MKLKYLLISTIITCNYTMSQETTLDGIIKRLSKASDIESDAHTSSSANVDKLVI